MHMQLQLKRSRSGSGGTLDPKLLHIRTSAQLWLIVINLLSDTSHKTPNRATTLNTTLMLCLAYCSFCSEQHLMQEVKTHISSALQTCPCLVTYLRRSNSCVKAIAIIQTANKIHKVKLLSACTDKIKNLHYQIYHIIWASCLYLYGAHTQGPAAGNTRKPPTPNTCQERSDHKHRTNNDYNTLIWIMIWEP